MSEAEEIYMPSAEEAIEAYFRAMKDRPNVSMTYLTTLEEMERRVKKHYKRMRKLEAAAKALLECEEARRKTADGFDLRVPPDKQLYMRAVELAREALEGGEHA